jgi:hypothetical protein
MNAFLQEKSCVALSYTSNFEQVILAAPVSIEIEALSPQVQWSSAGPSQDQP